MTTPTATMLHPSSIQKRLGAGALDFGLMALLLIVFAMLFGTHTTSAAASEHSYQLSLTGVPFVIYLLTALLYFILFEWRLGATPGKLALGLRVVNTDGQRISLEQAAARNVLRIVDGFPYLIPYALGITVMASNPSRKRVGDSYANTMVIELSPRPSAAGKKDSGNT